MSMDRRTNHTPSTADQARKEAKLHLHLPRSTQVATLTSSTTTPNRQREKELLNQRKIRKYLKRSLDIRANLALQRTITSNHNCSHLTIFNSKHPSVQLISSLIRPKNLSLMARIRMASIQAAASTLFSMGVDQRLTTHLDFSRQRVLSWTQGRQPARTPGSQEWWPLFLTKLRLKIFTFQSSWNSREKSRCCTMLRGELKKLDLLKLKIGAAPGRTSSGLCCCANATISYSDLISAQGSLLKSIASSDSFLTHLLLSSLINN